MKVTADRVCLIELFAVGDGIKPLRVIIRNYRPIITVFDGGNGNDIFICR
ncbi:hypothetical protein [Photobacterium iliopiscarium]|nr:hypothetical protein [Photobacterium iliopiscarium]